MTGDWRLVETDLGSFGLAWSAAGLCCVLLPGLERAAMAAQLRRFGEEGPGPDFAERAAALIARYARGEAVSFAGLPLDFGPAPAFHRRCYEEILKLGWGETTSYGELARGFGDVGLSRAVGRAMAANPLPLIVPCHRVLARNGGAGGFSAPGGAATKLRMLALEGVRPGPPGQLHLGF